MLYGFRIGAGSVAFRSRLPDSQAAREINGGRACLASFGAPTGCTPWQRLLQPVRRSTDDSNVNFVKMGDDWAALTEGARQMHIDPASLRAPGTLPCASDGPQAGGGYASALVKVDVHLCLSYLERDQVGAGTGLIVMALWISIAAPASRGTVRSSRRGPSPFRRPNTHPPRP